MRQLVGRKIVGDMELQYSVLGGGKKGYSIEICEISRYREEEALFPGDSEGRCRAQEFAKWMYEQGVMAVHLKGIVEDYIKEQGTPEEAT